MRGLHYAKFNDIKLTNSIAKIFQTTTSLSSDIQLFCHLLQTCQEVTIRLERYCQINSNKKLMKIVVISLTRTVIEFDIMKPHINKSTKYVQ